MTVKELIKELISNGNSLNDEVRICSPHQEFGHAGIHTVEPSKEGRIVRVWKADNE